LGNHNSDDGAPFHPDVPVVPPSSKSPDRAGWLDWSEEQSNEKFVVEPREAYLASTTTTTTNATDEDDDDLLVTTTSYRPESYYVA